MSNQHSPESLIGQANSFLEVLDHVSKAAPLNKPVLIIGERGTGKELIAARLHYLSNRWDQNYLSLNCGSLNENLLESELFGHESGAFTGASKRHQGRFERADKGTLFLDELANTSALVQEKLLRVIEYGEFERIGGSKPINVNVRIVAATNEDLPTLADQGRFRHDLLDRLSFDVITLPPLRERQEDILILAEKFAIDMAREMKLEFFAGFTEKAKKSLLAHPWPGNIRELKNTIERSLYRLNNAHISINNIIFDPFESPYRPININQNSSPILTTKTDNEATNNISDITPTRSNDFCFPLDFKEQSQNYEVSMIKQALASSQYNQKITAQMLGVTYHQLRGYLKKYNLLGSDGE